MNSMELLKALTDIEEEYLIEYELTQRKKEYLIINIIKEFFSWKNNKIILNTCYIIFIFLFIIGTKEYVRCNKKINSIYEGDSNEKNISIIINNYIPNNRYIDSEGNLIVRDLLSEFELNKTLNIPEDYIIRMQGELEEVTILENNKVLEGKKNIIRFGQKDESSKNYINIDFSKDELLINELSSLNKEYNEANESFIDGVKVKIFQIENELNEGNNVIRGEAYMKCNDYNIYISVKGIKSNQFVELLKSVIDSFKNK